MFNRKPPIYRGDVQSWANQIVSYLSTRDGIKKQNDPDPVLLPWQISGDIDRAVLDGVLMYDPVKKVPVYSKDGAWVAVNTPPTTLSDINNQLEALLKRVEALENRNGS